MILFILLNIIIIQCKYIKILHNTPPPSKQSCKQICVKCTKVEHVLDLRQTATKFPWRAGFIKVQLRKATFWYTDHHYHYHKHLQWAYVCTNLYMHVRMNMYDVGASAYM